MMMHEGEMRGRVCLITGATSGIGRVTAEALARRGATVVIVARDRARAEAAVGEITSRTGNPQVTYLLADLSSQAQVRGVVEEFRQRHDRLHVLLNNAGAVFTRRYETVDGLERTLAVNHLAPFLLTNLLGELLIASAPARVVTVASAAHVGARIPFDDLQQSRTRYRAFRVYGQTKLANILFTYELARRLQGTGVTANAAHPGFVATNFGKGDGGWLRYGIALARPFAITPERGAQTSIYLATSPEVAEVSGRYFASCKPVRSSRESYDEAAARRLWEVSAQLTGLSHTL
jgi:NAD(P)-dependent dehydrogenase (short-subunit alcohol dehydrogenase family)